MRGGVGVGGTLALVRLDCEGSLVAVSGAELAWVVGASRDD